MKTIFFALLVSVLFFSSVHPAHAIFGQKRARAEAENRAAEAETKMREANQEAENARKQAEEDRQHLQYALTALGLLVVIGLSYALVRNRVMMQVVNIHPPAHEIAAKSVVIDGTNVVRQSNGNAISLNRLLGVLIELEKKKYTYKCYFDANTFHVLRESGLDDHAQAYRDLLERYSAIFIEVPGRTRADDAILDYAHRHGTPIISNDQYRDYKEKYRWLEEDSKWRVPFVVHPSMLQLYRLGINANVPESLKTALTEFRILVQKNASRN